jgi:hypothetical protein
MPFGWRRRTVPWALFSDSTRFALSGQLRNFFVDGLPSVWLPGFVQIVSVVAVDRNFYDYNRSGNDPFGGTGLISSVRGGLGLFGSALAVLRRQVTVSDRDRLPLDARWRGTTASGSPMEYDLWVESVGSPRSSVSGRERLGAVASSWVRSRATACAWSRWWAQAAPTRPPSSRGGSPASRSPASTTVGSTRGAQRSSRGRPERGPEHGLTVRHSAARAKRRAVFYVAMMSPFPRSFGAPCARCPSRSCSSRRPRSWRSLTTTIRA